MTATHERTHGVVTLIRHCYECRKEWVERWPGNDTEYDSHGFLINLGSLKGFDRGCVYCGYLDVSTRKVDEFSPIDEGSGAETTPVIALPPVTKP